MGQKKYLRAVRIVQELWNEGDKEGPGRSETRSQVRFLVENFIKLFQTNPQFNETKFRQACQEPELSSMNPYEIAIQKVAVYVKSLPPAIYPDEESATTMYEAARILCLVFDKPHEEVLAALYKI